MSGGHWNYKANELEEMAGTVESGMRLLAQIEHELDWGICCDTCLECAKLRTIAALIQFYDDGCRAEPAALAVLRDQKQNRCPKCVEWDQKHGGPHGR